MAESAYFGIYQGITTQIDDPSCRGRIKCQIPDVLAGEVESAWCEPMIPVAYDGGGDFCLPRVGESVWVMFIAGNPNRPVWLGGWWSSEKTPLGSNYTDIDAQRIINYADCTISMQNGIIDIDVGDTGSYTLRIKEKKVTVKGNLVVTGDATIGGISFLDHVHGGVTFGYDSTSSPS